MISLKSSTATITLTLLSIIVFSVQVHSQVKTIPGAFISDFVETSGYERVSSSGNTIATKNGTFDFVIFDLQKSLVTTLNRRLSKISSNHKYIFDNSSFVARQTEKYQNRWAWQIKSAGIASDTALQILTTDYFALDIDEKNNFIATKIWYDSARWQLSGMKGLYKLDRTTGKVLQTLREDTLFTCKDPNGCWLPSIYLQKNYAAVSLRTFHEPINILPYGETKKIQIPRHNYNNVKADSLYIFTIADSTILYNLVNVFDARTGTLVTRKQYNRPENSWLQFESNRNKLYCMNIPAGTINEETVGKDSLATTKTWDINSTLGLSKKQNWLLTVGKGPSFFIAPLLLKKGESGGAAANTAFVFQGQSNKVTLQVTPFFNRSGEVIASQAKSQKEQEAWMAKVAAEKDSLAHPERYCHKFWGIPKYKRGLTIFWGSGYMIMADYDCKNDEYKLWRPMQLSAGGNLMNPDFVMVPGKQFRAGNYTTNKHWETCTVCEGDGTMEITRYTTKTKELPWGYFSGIEVKKTTTTSKTTVESCKSCSGQGVILK